MAKIAFILVGIFIFLLFLNWEQPDVGKIKPKMTIVDVEGILGEPFAKTTTLGLDFWQYGKRGVVFYQDSVIDKTQNLNDYLKVLTSKYINEQIGWWKWVPVVGDVKKGNRWSKMGYASEAKWSYFWASVNVAAIAYPIGGAVETYIAKKALMTVAEEEIGVLAVEEAGNVGKKALSEIAEKELLEASSKEALKTLSKESQAVHGNSLNSLRLTWFYKLFSNDGTFLKNGITSETEAESRYTKAEMEDRYMEKLQFPNRKAAYDWEFKQNKKQPGPWNLNEH